jgi:L-fucose mutarotase
MLIGIDPLLSPECLATLRAMGHGDEVVLVDANFPAEASARHLVRLDGVPLVPVLRAVLSVLPVDDFEPDPLVSMAQVDDPAAVPEAVAHMQAVVREMLGPERSITPLERFAFYDRARRAHAVIATGERRFYGNLIIRKGVVPPPEQAPTGSPS